MAPPPDAQAPAGPASQRPVRHRPPGSPAPADPPSAPLPAGARAWAAGFLTLLVVLLLVGVATGEAPPGAGGDRSGATAAGGPPAASAEAAGGRAAILEGEWLRLVGPAAGAVGDRAPLGPPGSGVLAPARERAFPLGWLWPVQDWVPPALAGLRRPADGAALALAGGRRAGAPSPWLSASASRGNAERPAVALPPPLDGYAHDHGPEAWVDGVSYADPLGVGLPLLRTGGLESLPISAHFRVGDFSTRDGAPYARVAADLVAGLEAMRALVGPITVISGYRHPRYNALPSVGGARYSRHQSGQAADVWSAERTTVELAHAAVQAMGCGIGIGLGENTVHVDVRGSLSTWTYRGAPLDRRTFDQWIRSLCGGAAPAPPPRRRPVDPAWFADAPDDEEEVVHLSETAVEEAVVEAEAAVAPPPGLDAVVRRDLAAFARAAYGREGPGVVVVDLRDGEAADGEALVRRAHYARAATPEVRLLGLGPLLRWAEGHPSGEFFVYAVRQPGGRVETGVAPTEGGTAPPPPAPAAAGARPARWLLVVATGGALADAEAALDRHRAPLRAVGLGAVLRVEGGGGGTRYSVVVGPFETEADAVRARGQAEDVLPEGARIVQTAG